MWSLLERNRCSAMEGAMLRDEIMCWWCGEEIEQAQRKPTLEERLLALEARASGAPKT